MKAPRIMTFPFRNMPLAASIVLLLKSVTPAYAQATYYWDNNGTSTSQGGFGTNMAAGSTWAAPTTTAGTVGWSTSATGDLAPVEVTTSTLDTLNFRSGGTLTVSGTVDAGTINSTLGLTITGGTINLAASVTITVAQPLTIASALSGAGTELTKSGSQILTLSENNSYTGVTNITAGALQFAKTQALYGGNTSNWTAANIKAANISTLSFNVGGTDEFSTSDITTLISNLGGDVTAGGMRSGSRWGFNPTNASGGNFTVADVIANTTGTGGGAIGLTKYGSNQLTLSGLNTFSNDVLVENGTVSVNTISTGSNAQSLGTNSIVNLGGNTGSTGVLEFTGSTSTTDKQIRIGRINSAAQVGNASVLNNGTGSLTFSNAAFNAFVTGQGSAARTLTLGGNYSGGANEIQGIIRHNVSNGTGGVNVVVSGSHWKLSGANSYTGTTVINSGTLTITGATQATSAITFGGGILGLDIASSVTATGATVDFTGQTVTVTGSPTLASYTLLTVGTMVGGDTEPTLSPAIPDYELDVVGNELRLVSTGAPSGYAAWQATNGTIGDRGADHDNDGVDNGTEHFLGGNGDTTGFTALPAVANNLGILSVTWTRHPDYPGFPGNYGTDVVVETSATLTGPWTPEVGGNVTITGNDIEYTFPGGPAYSDRNFARLKVTGP